MIKEIKIEPILWPVLFWQEVTFDDTEHVDMHAKYGLIMNLHIAHLWFGLRSNAKNWGSFMTFKEDNKFYILLELFGVEAYAKFGE